MNKLISVLVTLVIGTACVLVGWCVVKSSELPVTHEHVPRISQQESRQMIKEIHEHLLGERP